MTPDQRTPPPADREASLGQWISLQSQKPAELTEHCPDPESLAGFNEGRLLPRERETVAAHLSQCVSCRELVRMLGDGGPTELQSPGVPWWRGPRFRAAAAAVLFGGCLGLGAWLTRTRKSAPTEDEFHRLSTAVADLAGRELAIPSGFRVRSQTELLSESEVVERSSVDVVPLSPKGRILEQPKFLHAAVPRGSKNLIVTILDENAQRVHRVVQPLASHLESPASDTVVPIPWPPTILLPTGVTWTWSIRAEGPSGNAEASASFQREPEADAARFDSAVAAFERALAPVDAATAAAQLALSLGYLDVAEAKVRRAVLASPESQLARATLQAILVRIGSPEATAPARDPSQRGR